MEVRRKEMAENKKLATLFKRQREAHGYTRHSLAKKLGIPVSKLDNIEHGKTKLAGNIILRLKSELGIDLISLSDTGVNLSSAMVYFELGNNIRRKSWLTGQYINKEEHTGPTLTGADLAATDWELG